MPKRKNMKRYHRQIYFPEWAEESIQKYLKKVLSNTPITYSLHAVDKITEFCWVSGKSFVMDSLRNVSLQEDKIFEFYASGEEIKKACFRFSAEDFPVDFILVVSEDGVVITLYVINQGDNHSTLNKNLYERSTK